MVNEERWRKIEKTEKGSGTVLVVRRPAAPTFLWPFLNRFRTFASIVSGRVIARIGPGAARALRILVGTHKGWIDARTDDQREFRERAGSKPA